MYTSPVVYLSESLDWVYQVRIPYLIHTSVVIVIVRIFWTVSLRYSPSTGPQSAGIPFISESMSVLWESLQSVVRRVLSSLLRKSLIAFFPIYTYTAYFTYVMKPCRPGYPQVSRACHSMCFMNCRHVNRHTSSILGP